jgi:uncharacterized protein YuzE
MLLKYHTETDMLYIQLADEPGAESEEVSQGIVLDYNGQNQVVGIEIEDASKLVDVSRLEVLALPISNLILSERATVQA